MKIRIEKSNYYKDEHQFILGVTFTKESNTYDDDSLSFDPSNYMITKEYCFNIWIGYIGFHIIYETKKKKLVR